MTAEARQHLGAILQKVTQKSAEFACEALFEPLGITHSKWVKMPNGEVVAASGPASWPRDMAKSDNWGLDYDELEGEEDRVCMWLEEWSKDDSKLYFLPYLYHWWTGTSQVGEGKSIGLKPLDWAVSVSSLFLHYILSLYSLLGCIE